MMTKMTVMTKVACRLLFILMLTLSCLTLNPQRALAAEPLLGEIKLFAGNFAPRGWALCQGQILPISQNTALFSILGTTYGGDGRTTFGLPDLRGRVAVSEGQGPGLSSYRLGQKGGVENVTLNVTQLPAHSHTLPAFSSEGNSAAPQGNVPAKSGVGDPDYNSSADGSMAPSSNAGGGQSHTNIQPFQTLNYIIALVGIFPSRN